MRPLVIDDRTKAAVSAVLAYAEAHVISLEELAKLASAGSAGTPIGDEPGRSLIIPFGYHCTFTLEVQKAPLNLCRHLSVSVYNASLSKPLPSEQAVFAIMDLFGFRPPRPGDVLFSFEDVKGNALDGTRAITVIQPVKLIQ